MKSIEPQVGQEWDDMDPRSEGRRVRIVAIVDDTATCVIVSNAATATIPTVGKMTRISLRRLKPGSNGYRLVEADPESAS